MDKTFEQERKIQEVTILIYFRELACGVEIKKKTFFSTAANFVAI